MGRLGEFESKEGWGEDCKLLRFYATHPQRMLEINSTLWCLLG